ncbi:MAG: hypothetical protein J6C05_04275 [Prevotella sp.]|nr:hypothetical protein [Prevotella sp.]
MKSFVSIIFICMILSCSESRESRMALQRAVSVMNDAPDSALHILDSLKEHEQQFGRHFRMQCSLHRTNALNKLDTLFHTTDGTQQLTDYFDDHGTPNEKMLAHYLLGRAYYDTGESPMALKCFQDAVAMADTTAKDCDYWQLSRVYGQMGNIFWQQNLLEHDLECTDKAIKYAYMAGDTINALLNMADKITIYDEWHKTDSAIFLCEKLSMLFRKYGHPDIAASMLGASIDLLLDKGDIIKAKKYINIYDTESGFFDANGNIECGREVYYYSKGRYYLAVNQYDSAEYYFRKELRDGKDFNNQNVGARGLALLFQQTNRPDSAAKYALYSYEMNDSVYARMATKEIEKNYNLYNYIRHQEIAQQEKEQKEAAQSKVVWLICILMTAIFLGIYYFLQEKRKRDEKHRQYMNTLTSLAQMQSDVDRLKEHRLYIEHLLSEERQKCLNLSHISEDKTTALKQVEANAEQMKKQIAKLQQIIEEKETEIFQLQSNLPIKYQSELKKNDLAKVKLSQHKNYAIFNELVTKGQTPTSVQWQQIADIVVDVFPSFNDFLTSKKQLLNDKELHTCILLRLYVKPTAIASMLDVTPAYISKIRSEMLKRLFCVNGAPKDFDELLMQII